MPARSLGVAAAARLRALRPLAPLGPLGRQRARHREVALLRLLRRRSGAAAGRRVGARPRASSGSAAARTESMTED